MKPQCPFVRPFIRYPVEGVCLSPSSLLLSIHPSILHFPLSTTSALPWSLRRSVLCFTRPSPLASYVFHLPCPQSGPLPLSHSAHCPTCWERDSAASWQLSTLPASAEKLTNVHMFPRNFNDFHNFSLFTCQTPGSVRETMDSGWASSDDELCEPDTLKNWAALKRPEVCQTRIHVDKSVS